MKTYLKRLRIHPGVPVASMLTLIFMLAGLGNKNWLAGVIAGAVVSILMWCVVLWTARTQPLPEDR